MTNEQLTALNRKELTDKARQLGVAHSPTLRKEELVKAIARALKKVEKEKAKKKEKAKEQPKPSANKVVAKSPTPKSNPKPVSTPTVNGKTKPNVVSKNGTHPKPQPQKTVARDTSDTISAEEEINRSKFDTGTATRDLSPKMPKEVPTGYQKDRIVVAVIDPFWLHCYWELTQQSIQRAEAALGPDWHSSKPILRVLDVSAQDTTSTAESILKDIEVQPGNNNWYIQVDQPPKSYRVDIGYISRRGQFFRISSSDIVTTPKAGVSESVDSSWPSDEKQAERIIAMSTGFNPSGGGSSLELKRFFEERFRKPLGSSPISSLGSSSLSSGKERKFFLEIEAVLTVYGRTEPGAKVTLQGEPMILDPQGRFGMQYKLEDGRQIIPAVAASVDGIEERTIVLAVERNTKQLEPMIHDTMNEPV
jgi:uncharacterized protein